MVEIKRIEGSRNIVPDTLSRYPQEDGESFEDLIAPGNMETSFSHMCDTSCMTGAGNPRQLQYCMTESVGL